MDETDGDLDESENDDEFFDAEEQFPSSSSDSGTSSSSSSASHFVSCSPSFACQEAAVTGDLAASSQQSRADGRLPVVERASPPQADAVNGPGAHPDADCGLPSSSHSGRRLCLHCSRESLSSGTQCTRRASVEPAGRSAGERGPDASVGPLFRQLDCPSEPRSSRSSCSCDGACVRRDAGRDGDGPKRRPSRQLSGSLLEGDAVLSRGRRPISQRCSACNSHLRRRKRSFHRDLAPGGFDQDGPSFSALPAHEDHFISFFRSRSDDLSRGDEYGKKLAPWSVYRGEGFGASCVIHNRAQDETRDARDVTDRCSCYVIRREEDDEGHLNTPFICDVRVEQGGDEDDDGLNTDESSNDDKEGEEEEESDHEDYSWAYGEAKEAPGIWRRRSPAADPAGGSRPSRDGPGAAGGDRPGCTAGHGLQLTSPAQHVTGGPQDALTEAAGGRRQRPSKRAKALVCRVCMTKSGTEVRPCCKWYVCSPCMTAYVAGRVREGLVKNLQCPSCNTGLSDTEVLRSLPSEPLRHKWRQFRVDTDNDPNVKTCPGCGHITDLSALKASVSSPANRDRSSVSGPANRDRSSGGVMDIDDAVQSKDSRAQNKGRSESPGDEALQKSKTKRSLPKTKTKQGRHKATTTTTDEDSPANPESQQERPDVVLVSQDDMAIYRMYNLDTPRAQENSTDTLVHVDQARESGDQTDAVVSTDQAKDSAGGQTNAQPRRLSRDGGKRRRGSLLPVTCSECALEWCFACHAPWHAGLTCAEYLKGDKQFLQWTTEREVIQDQRNAQQCPKCKVYIQRYRGCRKMVCRMCGTSFCYICGSSHCNQVKRFFLGSHSHIVTHRSGNDAKQRLVRTSYTGVRVAAGTTVVIAVGVAAAALSPIILSAAGVFLLVRAVRKRRAHRRYMEHCRQRAELQRKLLPAMALQQQDRVRLQQLYARDPCCL